ncbi:cytochrome P450 CYP94D108-like isoform X1 [Carex rostrata]
MDLSLIFSCFLIPILLLTLYHFFHQDPKKQTTTFCHKTYPLIGDLFDVIKNRNRIFDWTTEILIDNPTHTTVSRVIGFRAGILTANPKNVEYILKTKSENYPRSETTISLLEDLLGHGIFNSNGEHWHWQRKTASLAFATRSLRGFMVDTFDSEIIHRLIPYVERMSEKGELIDIQDVLERFAFDNVSRVVFDVDPASLTEEGSELMRSCAEAIDCLIKRFPIVWRGMKWLNIGSEKRLRESIVKIKSHVTRIIHEKLEKPSSKKSDLISHIASSEEHTMVNLVDFVTNLLLAGGDTVSAALSWFFWLVLTQPDVEEKILQEIRSIRNIKSTSSSEMFGYDELREMHYLHAAITEAMRLYPPLAIDTQSCKEDDTLPDGTVVKKGWAVSYHAYAMGRMEDIWGVDCSEYKPERWLENGVFKPESPFKYSVFHAGPRMCLGKEMAYIQMKSIAAFLFERYKIEVVMEGKPDHLVGGTLKMKGGLPAKFSKREHI